MTLTGTDSRHSTTTTIQLQLLHTKCTVEEINLITTLTPMQRWCSCLLHCSSVIGWNKFQVLRMKCTFTQWLILLLLYSLVASDLSLAKLQQLYVVWMAYTGIFHPCRHWQAATLPSLQSKDKLCPYSSWSSSSLLPLHTTTHHRGVSQKRDAFIALNNLIFNGVFLWTQTLLFQEYYLKWKELVNMLTIYTESHNFRDECKNNHTGRK